MTQFKAGDKIVCVATTKPEWFTVGKGYEVIKISKTALYDEITIIDDEGEENDWANYTGNWFILASEYKKQNEDKLSPEIAINQVKLYFEELEQSAKDWGVFYIEKNQNEMYRNEKSVKESKESILKIVQDCLDGKYNALD